MTPVDGTGEADTPSDTDAATVNDAAAALAHVRLQPGPLAWLVILAGFAVMGRALLGVFAESERTAPASWFTWLIGGALIHDLVLLPLVLAIGAGFACVGRRGLRRTLRWAVAVGAVITLASFPVVARFGARADNPSVLPLPAGRNLVIVWCVLLVGAVLLGLGMDWWGRGHGKSDGAEVGRVPTGRSK